MGLFDHNDRAIIHSIEQGFSRVEALLRLVLRRESNLINEGTHIMSLLDDIEAAENATIEKLTTISNAQTAVKTALDAQTAKIAELTSDLAAAGTDQGRLQAVLDKANAILASTDNAATAEAALAGTPHDAPAPPVEEPSEPVITSISPTNGAVAGGDTVSISGGGFTDATDVSFGGVAGTNLTVNNDTSISVTTPAGTAGDATVVVTTPVGISAPGVFTYA